MNILITGTSQSELDMRINDMATRGWELKAQAKPDYQLGGITTYKKQNGHHVCEYLGTAPKFRAVMTREDVR